MQIKTFYFKKSKQKVNNAFSFTLLDSSQRRPNNIISFIFKYNINFIAFRFVFVIRAKIIKEDYLNHFKAIHLPK